MLLSWAQCTVQRYGHITKLSMVLCCAECCSAVVTLTYMAPKGMVYITTSILGVSTIILSFEMEEWCKKAKFLHTHDGSQN